MPVMEKNNKKTSIALSEGTKKQLAQFENEKGESFDDILKRVMDSATILCNKTSEDADVVTTEPGEEE